MTASRKLLFDFKPVIEPTFMSAANSAKLNVVGHGQLWLRLAMQNDALCLDDVAIVPDLGYNIISLGKLDRAGMSFTIRENV